VGTFLISYSFGGRYERSDEVERANESIKSAGAVAWRSILTIVVVVGVVSATAVIGFLAYRERVTPEPFLLLLGIVVGFLPGRLDAVLQPGTVDGGGVAPPGYPPWRYASRTSGRSSRPSAGPWCLVCPFSRT